MPKQDEPLSRQRDRLSGRRFLTTTANGQDGGDCGVIAVLEGNELDAGW
jgi:hypothetical protein